MVTHFKVFDIRPYFDDDAAALVPQNGGQWYGELLRLGCHIGMAYADRAILDKHLVVAGAFQIHFFNAERFTRFPGNRGFNFHI
jgi:hypothetical protein